MRISQPVFFYEKPLFKALIIFLALVLMPVVWRIFFGGTLSLHAIVGAWPFFVGHFFAHYPRIATVIFTFALVSVVLWWRYPRQTTALLMFLMLTVVCGAPGGAMLTMLFWRN